MEVMGRRSRKDRRICDLEREVRDLREELDQVKGLLAGAAAMVGTLNDDVGQR